MTFARVLFVPAGAWSRWNLASPQLVPALFAAGLYAIGLYASGIRAVSRARAMLFFGGVAVALLATMSPLHAAADLTFSAHMTQHEVLMLLAAPMIVAGRPGLVMALALPHRVRIGALRIGRAPAVAVGVRALRNPLAILLFFSSILWMWHLPGLYDAAVTDPAVHAAEHISFLAGALAFWSGVMRTGPRRRVDALGSMALVLGTMLLTTWLAAVLTFGNLDYPAYVLRARLYGIDPAADQQLAGTIMWVPGAIVSFLVFGALFKRWLSGLERLHPRDVEVPA